MSRVEILDNGGLERWDGFVLDHDLGSIYHTSLWRNIIEEAYGHRPLYLVIRNSQGGITAGIPFFHIETRITGNRLSSVPCAQCCNPLVTGLNDYRLLLQHAARLLKAMDVDYIEMKTSERFPFHNEGEGTSFERYRTYILDLEGTLDDIKRTFHKSCIQRAIKKAYGNNLVLAIGNSTADVRAFYHLYLNMRKQYGLLPQPYRYFQSLWQHLAGTGGVEILHARHEGRIISSLMLLKYKHTVIYEYGASISGMMHLNPSHFLLWEAIRRAKEQGYRMFDFGRTDNENTGLINFKERWGTRPEVFFYRYLSRDGSVSTLRQNTHSQRAMHYTMRLLPAQLCHMLGGILYKSLV